MVRSDFNGIARICRALWSRHLQSSHWRQPPHHHQHGLLHQTRCGKQKNLGKIAKYFNFFFFADNNEFWGKVGKLSAICQLPWTQSFHPGISSEMELYWVSDDQAADGFHWRVRHRLLQIWSGRWRRRRGGPKCCIQAKEFHFIVHNFIFNLLDLLHKLKFTQPRNPKDAELLR